RQVKVFALEPRSEFRPEPERRWKVRVPIEAGPHDVTVAFLKLPSISEADSRMERFRRPNYLTGVVGEPSQTIYMPYVDRVTIMGPLAPVSPSGPRAIGRGRTEVETPSRRTILTCQPGKASDETKCAQKILASLARRAFRRPVTDADVQPLLKFYHEGR